MYFPIGSIKCHNAGLNNSAALSFVGLNRTKTLIVVLSPDSVYLWKTKVCFNTMVHFDKFSVFYFEGSCLSFIFCLSILFQA